MKKLFYFSILILSLTIYSCGEGTTITVNTPSTRVTSLYDLKVKKLCFGNKLKEKNYWNNRVVEVSGDILSIDLDHILIWENNRGGVSESIRIYTDQNTIMKLEPSQKNVKFKGVLRVTGTGDKMCDTKTTYITNGLIITQAALTDDKPVKSGKPSSEATQINPVLKNNREEPLITPKNNHLIKDMWIGIQKSHNMLNKSGEEMIIRGNKVVMPETQHKIRFYPDNIVDMEQIYGYTNDKYKGLYSGKSIGWISAEFSLQPEEQYEYAVKEVADEKEIKVDELTNEIKKLKYTFSYSGPDFDYLKVRSSNGIEFKVYRESSGRWKKKANTKVEDTSIPEIIEFIEDERGAGIDEVEEVHNAVVGNIHISIRNFKASIFSFKTSKFLIRIDELEDKTFRYSSWNKNSSFNDKPDLKLNNGERFYEGSGGNNYFLFKSGAYSYQIWENKVSNKTSDYTLKVYRNEDLLGEYESVK